MKKYLLLFILILIVFTGCVNSSKAEGTLLGKYPEMTHDIKETVESINNSKHSFPKLEYGKLTEWEEGYKRVLLDNSGYKLIAYYDLDKKLKEIFYQFDYTIEEIKQDKKIEGLNLLFELIHSLDISHEQFDLAYQNGMNPNSKSEFIEGMFDDLYIDYDINEEKLTVKVQGSESRQRYLESESK